MTDGDCSTDFGQFWQEELAPGVRRDACIAMDEALRKTAEMIMARDTWPVLTGKQQSAALRNARNLWERRRDTGCTPPEPELVVPGLDELCGRLGDLYGDLYETAAERREIEDPRDWLSKTYYIDQLRDALCR